MTATTPGPGQTEKSNPFAKLVIGCHHKAGTSVSFKIFMDLARKFGLKVWRKFHEPDLYDPLDATADWDLCFCSHSLVHDLMPVHSFKGWHSVRHPMALVYSAALYHLKCKEPWVDVPLHGFGQKTFSTITDGRQYNIIKDPNVPVERKIALYDEGYVPDACFGRMDFSHDYAFGRRTYREILAGAGLEEQLIFEMNTFSRGVILDMLRFPNDRRFHTVQVEDISFDPAMNTLRHTLADFGLAGDMLEDCLTLASRHLMWKTTKDGIGSHATTGMSEEWQHAFKGEVLKEFRRLFGEAEVALGYAPHNPA